MFCIVLKTSKHILTIGYHHHPSCSVPHFMAIFQWVSTRGGGQQIQAGYEKKQPSTNISLWHNTWKAECCQLLSMLITPTIMFIRMYGHAKMQQVSQSSHDWLSVLNKLVWSKYVNNSNRRLYIYIRIREEVNDHAKITQQNLVACIGKSETGAIIHSRYCTVEGNNRQTVVWPLCNNWASCQQIYSVKRVTKKSPILCSLFGPITHSH